MGKLLSLWFGWGAYLIVIAIRYAGFAFYFGISASVRWGRFFALELATFLTLGLFAALGGQFPRSGGSRRGWRADWMGTCYAVLEVRTGSWGTLMLFGLASGVDERIKCVVHA